MNYILTKNCILYSDIFNQKIFLKNEEIKNNFTLSMKKIKFEFDMEENKIFVNYLNKEKLNYKNYLWEKKIRKNIKELLKIDAKENDCFRIGRYIIKIQKINKKEDKKENTPDPLFLEIKKGLNEEEIEKSRKSFKSMNSKSNIQICRICLDKETPKNPFERDLCDCSNKNPAHLKCLLIWLQKKCFSKLRNKQIFYYDLTTLKCDICLKTYPKTILYKNKKKKIFEIDMNFEKDFISFQILDIETSQEIGIYYIEPEDQEYKFFSIGRNERALIKLEDISVSRNHSYLHYNKSNWFLIDRSSKYGTLKKIKDNHVIKDYNFLNQYVVGNFCFEFHQLFSKKICKCNFIFEKEDCDVISFDRRFDLKNNEDVFDRKISTGNNLDSDLECNIVLKEDKTKIEGFKIKLKSLNIDHKEKKDKLFLNEEDYVLTGRRTKKDDILNFREEDIQTFSFEYDEEMDILEDKTKEKENENLKKQNNINIEKENIHNISNNSFILKNESSLIVNSKIDTDNLNHYQF